MNIRELINKWNKLLKECGIDESLLKIRLILADVLKVTKEYLLINGEEFVSPENIKVFEGKMKLICDKEPFQYVLGYQEFMKMRFIVEKRCINPQSRYRDTCGRSIKRG